MRLRRVCAAALGLAALAVAGPALWIPVKAALAQHLLNQAWARAQAGEARARPWPWADSWPVARLRLPGRGISLIVLAGASGRTLAFGPGHLDGTAAPGDAGNSVIGGHRDTSLRFLGEVRPGEAILLDTPSGRTVTYRVRGTEIADIRQSVALPDPPFPMLTLVTCWPFEAPVPGGPLRYLVFADAVLESGGSGSI